MNATLAPKHTSTIPTADRSHAERAACMAAVAASRAGADPVECARVHAATYAAELGLDAA